MDEQFDKKLKSRIREVFDNYESPPADEAWLELRKKFPVKEQRKIAWLWWSSVAAILLVFLGIGLWMNNKPQTAYQVAVKHKTIQQPKTITLPVYKTDSVNQTDAAQNNIAATTVQPPPATTAKPAKNVKGFAKAAASAPIAQYAANNKKPVAATSAPGITPLRAADGTALNNIVAQQPQQLVTAPGNLPPADAPPSPVDTKPTPQQIARAGTPIIAVDNSKTDAAAGSKTTTVIVQQQAKTIDELLKESKPKQLAQQKTANKELKKVNFSVYAATYVNYAEGSANQVNAGAGFTSDIRLGKRVKLSTGVSLAQNTFSYAGVPPVSGNNKILAAASPSIMQNGLFSPAASVAELKSSNASLVGLDIPINIKYEFNPEKSDTYISAGLSSGTFVDERYTYRYAYRNSSAFGNTTTVTTQDQTTNQSFNNFYFGKTLNLSFGTGFPVGKTNRLVIEPFLKYPLGGLGAQQIHFGAGGINLKFNFTGKR